MCFFTKQSKEAVELKHRFGSTVEDIATFQTNRELNGFTFPLTPVITNDSPSLIQHFHWGLIPAWAKDQEIRKYTLNAKIETLTEKPSFKNNIDNRCLVIADGFYEWKWMDLKGKSKDKYLVSLPDNGLFAFAGIYSKWMNPETGVMVSSYSIITTEANPLMSEIHNSKKRMPVVLTPESEKMWLRGDGVQLFSDCSVELVAAAVS